MLTCFVKPLNFNIIVVIDYVHMFQNKTRIILDDLERQDQLIN